ncbi:TPA: class I SAM-dependent methyltransferase [Candidatus Poribacteria bacterium]|nr:class I SAM-dependent methyltransferase [Candidatus Poribacteria bacterium]HIA68664.1 class I SAM-dependent methyltransferase [Candidatus Poribacteria bacterium]HIB88219.1 class I SAM-dependent methyltransferase [Candidatus Poribacteria bacterium]HIB98682.1 class I SAM-dependent methyltransferase [Candidatus Poribacteria bacterium]HIO82264.1 class I SAM-dependent methyltransferase [Candidatus Poribacteria bacterium]
MAYIDFLTPLHRKTKRDYLARVNEFPKAEASQVAKQFGRDYWDGNRKYGYGGYHYDGRWHTVAEAIIQHYSLKPNNSILDVGCGKGFLLYEFTQILPGINVCGVDISEYAIENAKPEVKASLHVGNASCLPFKDNSFDFVISLNTLHNLHCYDLNCAIREIERVGTKDKYIVTESYRNEIEKSNLLYWQLTCESFYTPEEWKWWFDNCQYKGDYSFIYFE